MTNVPGGPVTIAGRRRVSSTLADKVTVPRRFANGTNVVWFTYITRINQEARVYRIRELQYVGQEVLLNSRIASRR